jgi:octaprenyl-diphosphate synthase
MPARKIRHPDGMSQDAVSIADFLSPVGTELLWVQDMLRQCLLTPYPLINQQLSTLGAGQGKMLRPALVLLTGKACGGIRPEHIQVAAMIEIIHTATLLHDDVIDQAVQRRNSPTANYLYGNTAAVLLGDFFLSRAFEAAVELNIPQVQKILTQTAQRICRGELLQNIRRADWAMSQDDFLEIIDAKTADLFSAACRLGAQIGGNDTGVIEGFAEYGRGVGMAFQMTDDILDITGDDEKIGKTLGTDAAQKKPTLPLIHCLCHQTPQQKEIVTALFSGQPEPGQFIAILNDSGSLDYARDTAGQFAHKAIASIAACPSCPAVEALIKIATAIGKRA